MWGHHADSAWRCDQDGLPEHTIIAADTTNRKNLLLLIQLRWLAVCGQVVTILYVQYWLDISLPLAAMAAVILFLIALNAVSLIRHAGAGAVTNTELFIELLLDVAALTVQLYLSGGASNPFVSLYLLQVTLGAILLEEVWSSWALAAATSACYLWLTKYYRAIEMPHEHHNDLLSLHIEGMFISFGLTVILLVLFITRINGNLRARDARLADLRQQSAEEQHIVRMGLLASGAAHELGSPLATLSVILNDWSRMPAFRKNPEIAEDFSEMQAQLDRCKAIVTGILLSSGEVRGEGSVKTTVNAFVDELVAEWRALRSPAHLEFANAFSPNCAIVSDAALKQMVFNVFDNALEASPDWLRVAVDRHTDDLVIAVSDNGPGFSEEMLAEFGRPYRSTKGRPGGGLGLFLVANVMRQLGGTVTARNVAGGGACVTLTLPLAALAPGGWDGK